MPANLYVFAKNYRPPRMSKDVFGNIKLLFQEFERFYEKITLNNLLLAYAYVLEGKPQAVSFLTREEEKWLYFKKLNRGEVSSTKFKQEFGHHGLDPFELSSKRFNEYSSLELGKLAKLTRGAQLRRKPKLTINDLADRKKYSVYVVLREELRHQVLLIIQALRLELLELAQNLVKLKKIKKKKQIFAFTYQQILNLEDDFKR